MSKPAPALSSAPAILINLHVPSFLTLYDGNNANGAQLAQLSGAKNDLETTRFTATGPAMFLQFTSDESLTAGGFAFSYTCGAAPPPYQF